MRNILTPAAWLSAAALAAGLGGATRPAGAASAAPFRAAHIAIPPELAATGERLELRGLGGRASGRFRLGEAQGRFTRSASRLGILDPLLVRRKGGSSFELAASGVAPALAGRCGWRESELNAGPVSLAPGRLAYRCAFGRDGRPIEAELVIADPKGPEGTLDGRARRYGRLFYEGRELEIRSVHRDARGGLPTAAPLGYLVTVDGRAVGAVDLNGSRKTIFAPRGGAEREAVLAAALALSVFWDPAEVGPEA